MGLGTAFHLSERGYRVTLLEKQKDVAKVASYINGAMICPSMTASWASLSLLSKVICFLWHIYLKFVHLLKFIYSEKATKFCEIVTLLLSVCTVDKSKVKISQNFVAFSEYTNLKGGLISGDIFNLV